MARLRALAAAAWPLVTAIGKYNHGKNRLLNQMIGHTAISVADRRETMALAEHPHDSVCWLLDTADRSLLETLRQIGQRTQPADVRVAR